MSVNSSSNSTLHPPLIEDHKSRLCHATFMALFISCILFLPLFILVIYVGYQRWRKQRSVATAAKTSHSDIFTFNMVVLELVGFVGMCLYFYGSNNNLLHLETSGEDIFLIITTGQTLFHLLTCVERYLAVVHPITYLGLRQAGGVRIRNISIGCVWVLGFVSLGLRKISVDVYSIYNLLLVAFTSIFISFCSLCVLHVLIRPGPGEVGGNRARVDQSKQRAFHTIMAIMGALLLKLGSNLVSTVLINSPLLSPSDNCLVGMSVAWLSLPSSLVLPLLFLHRAGELPGCKRIGLDHQN